MRRVCLLLLCLLLSCRASDDVLIARSPHFAIDARQFRHYLMQHYPERAGGFATAPQMMALKERVIAEMIEAEILYYQAKSAQTDLSSAQIQAWQKQFQSRYSPQQFERALLEAKITSQEWSERRTREQLIYRWLDALVDAQGELSPETLQAYYESHDFREGARIRLRHILTDSPEKADAVRERLAQGANFAKLAEDLSLAPERSEGGDLGWVGLGDLPHEFDSAYSLEIGEVSPVIPSAYGFHLFKVIARREARLRPLTEVEADIRLQIRQDQREQMRREMLDKYRSEFEVWIDADNLRKFRL